MNKDKGELIPLANVTNIIKLLYNNVMKQDYSLGREYSLGIRLYNQPDLLMMHLHLKTK